MTKVRKTHEKVIGKPCKRCGGTLRYGASFSCVKCTSAHAKTNKQKPEYKVTAKVYWMRKRYGISPAEMLAMLATQGGRCGCCGTTEPGNKNGWCMDHDHSNGALRAILCHGCNVGLGAFRDSPVRLKAAIEYLSKWDNKEKSA